MPALAGSEWWYLTRPQPQGIEASASLESLKSVVNVLCESQSLFPSQMACVISVQGGGIQDIILSSLCSLFLAAGPQEKMV